MGDRKYTEARKNGNKKWDDAHLDRVSVAMPKGTKDRIRAYCESTGESINRFMNRVVLEAMQKQPQVPEQTASAPVSAQPALEEPRQITEEEMIISMMRARGIKRTVIDPDEPGLVVMGMTKEQYERDYQPENGEKIPWSEYVKMMGTRERHKKKEEERQKDPFSEK